MPIKDKEKHKLYMREYMREYSRKNRDKLNAQQRERHKNNPEKYKKVYGKDSKRTAYMREYTRKNKAELNKRRRELYKENPEYAIKAKKRYKKGYYGTSNYPAREHPIEKIINDIKLLSGCVFCGYKKHQSGLCFHHKDPTKKEFTISQFKRKKPETSILKEIDKCLILCLNCHAEEHARLHTLKKG